MRGRDWQSKEINYLMENYNRFSSDYIAKKLNRSKDSVDSKALDLGIEDIWEEWEVECLLGNYDNLVYVQIMVEKNLRNVLKKLKENKIYRTRAWTKEDELIMVKYVDSGFTFKEIGDIMYRGEKDIEKRYSKVK